MVLSCLLVSEIVPYACQHDAAAELLGHHLVDEDAVLRHKLGQRPYQVTGDGQLSRDDAGEVVSVDPGVELLVRQRHGGDRRQKVHIASGQSADRQIELVGERAGAVGGVVRLAALERAVAVQRDRPGHRAVGPELPGVELDLQFGVE